MRGTELNPAQVKRSQDAIKEASRQMMIELLPANVPWFTELFLDMLQQIGLVPMQETDVDILKNVSDKEKLQVRVSYMNIQILISLSFFSGTHYRVS